MVGLRIGICLDVKKKNPLRLSKLLELGYVRPSFVVPPCLYSYYYSLCIIMYPNLNIVSNNYPTCNLYFYSNLMLHIYTLNTPAPASRIPIYVFVFSFLFCFGSDPPTLITS